MGSKVSRSTSRTSGRTVSPTQGTIAFSETASPFAIRRADSSWVKTARQCKFVSFSSERPKCDLELSQAPQQDVGAQHHKASLTCSTYLSQLSRRKSSLRSSVDRHYRRRRGCSGLSEVRRRRSRSLPAINHQRHSQPTNKKAVSRDRSMSGILHSPSTAADLPQPRARCRQGRARRDHRETGLYARLATSPKKHPSVDLFTSTARRAGVTHYELRASRRTC